MVTVYSRKGCQQCRMTKKWLTDRGIDFEEKNTSDNEDYVDEVRSLGYQALPVVVAGDQSWSGFRPDRLEYLD